MDGKIFPLFEFEQRHFESFRRILLVNEFDLDLSEVDFCIKFYRSMNEIEFCIVFTKWDVHATSIQKMNQKLINWETLKNATPFAS